MLVHSTLISHLLVEYKNLGVQHFNLRYICEYSVDMGHPEGGKGIFSIVVVI